MNPVKSVSSSFGALTDTWTVIDPSSGLRFTPNRGVNDHIPQEIDEVLIVQFNNESLSPMFCTSKLPLTVAPGLISVHDRLPEQSKSEIAVSFSGGSGGPGSSGGMYSTL